MLVHDHRERSLMGPYEAIAGPGDAVGGRRPPRRCRRRGDRGQALLEFAFIVPIIVLLVAAFIEIGRAVHAWNTVTNAARQGVRVAVVNQIATTTECDQTHPIENPSDAHWSIRACAVAAASTLGISVSAVTVSYAPPPDTTLTCSPTLHVGCLASVTVTYDFTLATPFVANFIGPMTMTSTSEMPIERVFP
jgi:Flp pilus assembly protein TadG